MFRLQWEKKLLRKISLQGNDIEILEDCNDSYFDKYLNEVLYLFEHVDAAAIIFEDIDRFGTNTIFEKLREINTLLKSRNKSLRFIYLLRDDIFESSDRAKFFDFVIPVVPVIDSSNSFQVLKNDFEEAGFIDLFFMEFLESLCLFIDDMRILQNIENEFLIYKGKLEEKQIELNWNTLLALITYKNLFPKDFGELQLRRGYVYEEILSVGDEDASEIVKGIISLHAKIRSMDYENVNLRVAEQIYRDDAYELNTGMVNTFLKQ